MKENTSLTGVKNRVASHSPQKILYLVDTSSLFFRAYYAISSHLTSPTGLSTNALYGLLSMTEKFIASHQAEYIVYCLDHEKPSFRKEIYPEYKANRGEAPEDLIQQIPYIKKLISFLGIPSIEKQGYEADDLIGSLAKLGQKKGFKIKIVSSDKDFAQLVSSDISLYDPMKDITYDSEGVQKKWGVRPNEIIDYLALIGDASDNIPGVFGIGPKGAQKLIQKYGTLEKIYENLNVISKKIMEKLKKSQTQAFLSQKLVRIVTDIDLSSSFSSFKRNPIQKENLQKLLQDLGFKTFEKKLCQTEEVKSKKDSSLKKSKKLPSNLKLHILSWDELQETIPAYGKVWIFNQNQRYFLSYKHKVISLENHDLKKVGALFAKKNIQWMGYDLKKLWKIFNCPRPQAKWCAMIAVHLITAGPPGGIEKTAQRYVPFFPKQGGFNSLEPGEIFLIHKKLKTVLENKLETLNMTELYENIELPLIKVLYEIEKTGLKVDIEELKKQTKQVNLQIKKIENEIFNFTKQEFNISSPKQLADILFTKLKLKPIRKTKTGYSTDVEVLNKLKDKDPIIPLILDHRELFKLKTTYLEAFIPLVKKETGRIHTHFHQALTATGRLSSSNPNLQNIPIKSVKGRKIRKAFVAPEGKKIVAADYSQIELRVLAHVTEDPALCSAFQKDQDIHSITASEIYHIPLKEVTSQMRRTAKAINFGLIYGQSAYTLAESLGISVSSAENIITNYFIRFKKVKEYMDFIVETAHKQGYVQTLFGRRRSIKDLLASHFHTKKWGERIAINTPIQGTASDIVKLAMIELNNSLYSPILLQIHDELIFECPEDILEEEKSYIKQIMENIAKWNTPLKVHIHIGNNWEEAHS